VWVVLCLNSYASARQSIMQARVKVIETVLTALTSNQRNTLVVLKPLAMDAGFPVQL
jgi:hypothetical protein